MLCGVDQIVWFAYVSFSHILQVESKRKHLKDENESRRISIKTRLFIEARK